MKAQTALAMFLVFAVVFLLVGFYGYAFVGGDCSTDADCDIGETCTVGICRASGGSSCDPPCNTGEVCQSGSCVPSGGGTRPPPANSPPSGGPTACTGTDASVCPSGQTCLWTNCQNSNNQTEYEFDTNGQCVAQSYFDPVQRRWLTAEPCTSPTYSMPLPANYKPECLHTIALTQFDVDDYGYVCSGSTCGPGAGGGGGDGGRDGGIEVKGLEKDYQLDWKIKNGLLGPSVSLATAQPTFSITGLATLHQGGHPGGSMNKDVTNLFDRSSPQITLYVQDTTAATRASETTMSIHAKFKILVLNPSPTQKCVAGPSGKPQLVPLCAGTTAECTQTRTENASLPEDNPVRCIAVSSLNNWFNAGTPAYKCVDGGNYRALVTPQQFLTHSCTRIVTDPNAEKYGDYKTYGFSVTATRDNWTTRQLCPSGCFAGQCREVIPPCPTPPCPPVPGNRPPVLTSITASPRRTGINSEINMTSVASDPDSITTGTTTRREQIKLECGTAPGNITTGGGRGGTQGACRSGEKELEATRASSADAAQTSGYWCDNDPFSLTSRSTIRLVCAGGGGATAFIGTNPDRCQTWTFSNGRPDSRTFIAEVSCPGERTVTLDAGNYDVGVWTTSSAGRDGIACGPGSTTQTGGFTANLCRSTEFVDSNPNCTISPLPVSWPTAWLSGGQKDIYCRAKDESGLYSNASRTSVIVDTTPPTSVITSPPVNSVQRNTFGVRIVDSDDGQLDRCFYYTSQNTTERTRPCNGTVNIRVGPGLNCQQQGTCTVSAYARDSVGNVGAPDSRSFIIKLISTNITSPPPGYQTRNFPVSVRDMSSNPDDELTCTYDVYSISGSSSTRTEEDAERMCNSNFTVTVGPDEDCQDIGQNTCRVVAKLSNGVFSDSDARFYSIDWVTPASEIVAAPTSWVNADFTMSVRDDPRGSLITQCQYRVVSSGVETVRWTNRTCGIASPTSIRITVGNASNKNCRHEGGEACRVFVRPLDRARLPGIEDNESVAVTLSDADTNGFSAISALTTDRGINFSGTTRQELRAAAFYVCKAGSNINSCIAAYNAGRRGVNELNYCGSIAGRCELRCSDQQVRYYFVAQGTPVGEFRIVTALSPVRNAICPAFNIETINRLLGIFQQLEQDIIIQIMQTDTFIRRNGETSTANNETLDILNEALLLVKDHLKYMNTTMQDLNVGKAQEIITRSNERLDEISALLSGIRPPTRIRFEVPMPSVVRFNRSTSLTAVITKNGTTSAFGRVYCSITRPDGVVTRDTSSCLTLGAVYSIPFTPDRIGRWSYSCRLGRSVRSDCSLEVNQTPVAGVFDALPGFNTFVESISAPSMLIRNQVAVVSAAVNNPDDTEKFVSVRCDFTDPQNFVRRNSSSCINVPANNRSIASVNMIADRLGNWTVSRCSVSASQFSGCAGAVLDNVSQQSANYSVILPGNVFIESVTLPLSPVINDTVVSIAAAVNNPTSAAAYVNVTCNIRSPPISPGGPSINSTVSDRKGVEVGATRTFTLNVTANIAGTWTVANCTAFSSSNPDFSNSALVHTVSNLGTFDVVQGTELTITSVSIPANVQNGTTATIGLTVRNPSATRFGRVSCLFRDPLNQQETGSSTCLQINTSSSAAFSVGVFADRTGTWNVNSCSAFGSVNPDCSSAALHNSRSNVGTFDSVTSPPPVFAELFVQNISVPSTARANSNVNVIVSARNPNAANSTYAHVGCTFTDPNQNNVKRTSSCSQLTANSTQTFAVQQLLNMQGTWLVSNCFVNASGANNCATSVLNNVSAENRSILVSSPTDLYVTGVDAPDTAIVNNTNVNIDVFVSNPMNDDRYGLVDCLIESPTGSTQTRNAPCSLVQRQSSRRYNVSIFANAVGTWTVRRCSVSASSSSSCAGAVQTSELINGTIFQVIRGFNLTISSLSVSSPAYVSRPVDVFYTVRNPSASDRFGRVTCTFTRSGQSITNASACFSISRESFLDSRATFVPNAVGTWLASCTAERGFDSSCSSVEPHHVVSQSFEVVQTPDLFIQSVDMPELATKDMTTNAVLRIKNTALINAYGFAGCTFRNRLNETTRNVSSCENMTGDTTTVNIAVTPELRGNWSVFNCFVNASQLADCTQNRTHNRSTVSRSFNVYAPLLTIAGNVTLANENLVVGDLADIVVSVRNIGEQAYTAFVNCTLINPTNTSYRLSTPNQTIPMDEIREFHAQRIVDVQGRWRVGTCSVYRLGSIILETQVNVNKAFDVGYVPGTEECSSSVPCEEGFRCENSRCVQQPQCNINNCPGAKNACYCFDDQCIACGDGYTCYNARCVPETPVIQTCRTSADCASSQACINGVCQERPPECFANTDCASGSECVDSRCVVVQQQILDQDTIRFLIIILAVIMIPIILFIYIKHSL